MMTAIGLKRRLALLEDDAGSGFVLWVRIMQGKGQTEHDAYAAYEAEHGALGNRNVILRVVV